MLPNIRFRPNKRIECSVDRKVSSFWQTCVKRSILSKLFGKEKLFVLMRNWAALLELTEKTLFVLSGLIIFFSYHTCIHACIYFEQDSLYFPRMFLLKMRDNLIKSFRARIPCNFFSRNALNKGSGMAAISSMQFEEGHHRILFRESFGKLHSY